MQPPTICWFQEAIYQLTLFDSLSGAQISTGREGTYNGSEVPVISESFELYPEEDKNYEALVVIESLTGVVNASAQFQIRG